MSPSPSGSELPAHSFVFPVTDASHVGEVRRFAAGLSASCGMDDVRGGRVSIIINELGGNLVKYAQGGELILRRVRTAGDCGIEIVALDRGPGMVDSARARQDGYSTGVSPGTGLGAVERLSDVFAMHSLVGKGTVIMATVHAHEDEPVPDFLVGAINVPIVGERLCGDAWDVRVGPDRLDVIVVDGLGHGPLANAAARAALDVFDQTAPAKTLIEVMAQIHERLKPTRGGAVFLLRAGVTDEVTFTGVGNVRALVQSVGASRGLLSQNGTAGVQIRSARVLTESWDRRAPLIFHTDGITSRWGLEEYPGILSHHPSILAATIYRDFRRGRDDATVVVVGASR